MGSTIEVNILDTKSTILLGAMGMLMQSDPMVRRQVASELSYGEPDEPKRSYSAAAKSKRKERKRVKKARRLSRR